MRPTGLQRALLSFIYIFLLLSNAAPLLAFIAFLSFSLAEKQPQKRKSVGFSITFPYFWSVDFLPLVTGGEYGKSKFLS